jgi:hypothetical protein
MSVLDEDWRAFGEHDASGFRSICMQVDGGWAVLFVAVRLEKLSSDKQAQRSKLAAAAPAMYRAIEELLESREGLDLPVAQYDKLAAVLRKAEGRA